MSPGIAAREPWESREPRTGQINSRNPAMSGLEEAYLAQRIFRGEVGRYARNWEELSKVAAFRFEGREQWPGGSVPFGDVASLPIDLDGKQDDHLDIVEEKGSSDLVIEPIRAPSRQLGSH
jgi:hypothetical protein